MEETQTPPKTTTPVDEFIAELIANTKNDIQLWHVDLAGERRPRYYFNIGQGRRRLYLVNDWITPEGTQYSLRMIDEDSAVRESLVASEYMEHGEASPLRDLWTIVQEHIVEEDEFDVLCFARNYVLESQRRNTLDEICRILMWTANDIVDLFDRNRVP